jgi:hypothetical protein
MIPIVIVLAPSFWLNMPPRAIHKLKNGFSRSQGLTWSLGLRWSLFLTPPGGGLFIGNPNDVDGLNPLHTRIL